MKIVIRKLDSADHPFALDIAASTTEDCKLFGEVFTYLDGRKAVFSLGGAVAKPFKEDVGGLSLMAHPRPQV